MNEIQLITLLLMVLMLVAAIIAPFETFKIVCLITIVGLIVGTSIRAIAGPWDMDATRRGTTYYPTINGSGIPDFDAPRLMEDRRGRLHTTIPGTSLPDLGNGLENRGYRTRGGLSRRRR